MTTSRIVTMVIALVAVLAGWLLNTEVSDRYPLILIPQGVSSLRLPVLDAAAQQVHGRDVFVVRDGSIVTVLGKTTPGTDSPLVYCPEERFFVSPEDRALYDRDGRYVQGPGTHDMTRYWSRVSTTDGTLRVGAPQMPERSDGRIGGEAAQAYLDWRADPSIPRAFCQDPVS